MHARVAGDLQTFTGRVVLGCDGANSTIRELAGITMDDLGFTERWLVIDIQAENGLDAWDGVEQICDPARAATFMQVTGDRYRWEFRLRDGEDETSLITPQPSASCCGPGPGAPTWTACRSSAPRPTPSGPGWRPASRPDACSCSATPPTSPRRSSARAWRPGCATPTTSPGSSPTCSPAGPGQDLLASYEAERRPHAKALVQKAVRVGWAMTGGQDRAAAVRRIALAAAVRSERVCQAMGSTATPRLKAGALQRPPRRLILSGIPSALRTGGLIPNPLVSVGDGPPVRLDAILAGRTAVLTARRPDAGLVDFCRRHGLVLVRISSSHAAGTTGRPAADPDAGWIDVRLAGERQPAGLRALAVLGSNPALTVVVRPDRVVAAVEPRCRLPRLPWPIPATADRGSPVTAHPPAHPDHARPFPSTR